jgi:hypothetical protein
MPTKARRRKAVATINKFRVKVDKEQQVTYNNISLLNHQIAIPPEYPTLDDLFA